MSPLQPKIGIGNEIQAKLIRLAPALFTLAQTHEVVERVDPLAMTITPAELNRISPDDFSFLNLEIVGQRFIRRQHSQRIGRRGFFLSCGLAGRAWTFPSQHVDCEHTLMSVIPLDRQLIFAAFLDVNREHGQKILINPMSIYLWGRFFTSLTNSSSSAVRLRTSV